MILQVMDGWFVYVHENPTVPRQNATSRVEVSGIGGVGLDSQVLDRFLGGEQYVQIMVLFEKIVASNFKSFLFFDVFMNAKKWTSNHFQSRWFPLSNGFLFQTDRSFLPFGYPP